MQEFNVWIVWAHTRGVINYVSQSTEVLLLHVTETAEVRAIHVYTGPIACTQK